MLTLEMCKRLKDAGFRQDTELIYWKGDDDKWHIDINNVPVSIWVACPTADEIWMALTPEQQITFFTSRSRVTVYEGLVGYKQDVATPYSIETALAKFWLEVNR